MVFHQQPVCFARLRLGDSGWCSGLSRSSLHLHPRLAQVLVRGCQAPNSAQRWSGSCLPWSLEVWLESVLCHPHRPSGPRQIQGAQAPPPEGEGVRNLDCLEPSAPSHSKSLGAQPGSPMLSGMRSLRATVWCLPCLFQFVMTTDMPVPLYQHIQFILTDHLLPA